ncbi:MAG: zinc ABC transporter substrate-binding protein [Rubrobacter sp.]|jgi:manganese/zinc/iron transport system substrate-binding protein|nr:zinc ABC transporter substrate-binding protein [Rubrobacter sp.]
MDLRRFLKVSLAGVLAAALAVGCGGDSEEGSGEALAEDQPIQATVTTNIIGDLVEQVGGDDVEVTALMGPGVDPHLYNASQGDVSALQDADVVFYNGLFLEGQMQDILVQVGQDSPTVQVTGNVPEEELLESEDYEDQFDPHVWFDLDLWQTAVDPVVEQLSELRPDAAEDFEQRGEEYQQELEEADTFVEESISSILEEQRVLVTAHDAFRYFGERYGIEVQGLQGISTDAEVGSGDVQEVADFLAEREIGAIYSETSVPPRGIESVQAATQDRGWDVEIGGELYGDALGEPGTATGTLAGAMRQNAEIIEEGLT